ncbi:hypothetical protein [Paenibacillus crassostreae]|uniref:Uncharacterized protein n=1 Tax=Paenibacillus crassostreae TaxID=1763538 RepID=A0A167BW75_9BACL|nr:hypothetical protein [Paenibacillus crassostreae]AOZ92565.1 hypothetical protein LPB68_10170 [Paenibacillus crassostreae]OAB72514.1 hypothetical protein PNBC_16615 [Paenibacillus crassostreae]
MAWNIGLLCIKAGIDEVDSILDIFYKSKEGLHFEEVTSVSMGSALGVGQTQSWILIVDTEGRFIEDLSFPLKLSKKYKVKTFWISESLIYRDYFFSIFKKGGLKTELKGLNEGLNYLNSKGIRALDEWGETIIFQIIEKEIFGNKKGNNGTSLMELKFSKYELD